MADAQGRIISGVIRFRLTPPQEGIEIGDTDAAHEIGISIVKEMLLMMRTLAEKEGFFVEISYDQVVY